MLDVSVKHTDSKPPEFLTLVKALDAYLAIVDGDDHPFYAQYNVFSEVVDVVLVRAGGRAVGCGALKPLDVQSCEVKRMFVEPGNRGQGIGSTILNELEKIAVEKRMRSCFLETGHRQKDAIALYRKCGYVVTDNYGPYVGVEGSVCMVKVVSSPSG